MKRQGVLFVLSGPSGAGKGTVLKQALPHLEHIAVSVSATTREPRFGEMDGIHYYFKTEAEFQKMIEENAFLEYVAKFKNKYGTPKAPVQKMLDEGTDVILEIETMGAAMVKKNFPEAVLLFITPSSYCDLEKRLLNRGSEGEEQRKLRLETAREEYKSMTEYDYIAVNDDLDECVKTVTAIIEGERSKTKRNQALVERFLNL